LSSIIIEEKIQEFNLSPTINNDEIKNLNKNNLIIVNETSNKSFNTHTKEIILNN